MYMLKPNPQCDAIRRWGIGKWLGHEGGALTNGISGHIQETPESSFIPSACEGTEEEAIQEAERKLSPDRICQHLDLTSQPRDCEKGKSVVYATYSIFVFLLYV